MKRDQRQVSDANVDPWLSLAPTSQSFGQVLLVTLGSSGCLPKRFLVSMGQDSPPLFPPDHCKLKWVNNTFFLLHLWAKSPWDREQGSGLTSTTWASFSHLLSTFWISWKTCCNTTTTWRHRRKEDAPPPLSPTREGPSNRKSARSSNLSPQTAYWGLNEWDPE